ncbi:TIGR03089 family protein [Actinokineospora fastidiosa]|uniref:TIGR03089 family protein n=1 Tax=Actinokineospora fastidiosa TaxID=1816 RepID=A0A918G9K3_9PSEU|nr:TIGR03089 family protein [Actinokineospora fastidiosa]GGS25372.1 TIGR03089 family protein [Actinokineospora fastidiosa]
MSLTEHLLSPLPPARPAVTHYDDAAGTRVELSAATLANWAAKTANWLVDEHDVEPGDPVAVRLPAHWQTAGVLLGAWWCGAHVVADGDARVTFVVPGETGPGVLAAVSLDPMGRDLGGPVDGAADFVGEARLCGDDFLGGPLPGDTPALAGMTVDEVLAAARALDLPRGARVLSTRDWTVPDGVLAALVAPLAAGGSVVQVSNPARLDAHRAAERTTVDL